MNEELTLLEKIDLIYSFACLMCNEDSETLLTQYKNDIEIALKRLEIYDKCNYQTTIHKDVLQISKELKALEIIVNKHVNVSMLMCSSDISSYNQDMVYERCLTQEEYNFLKEVL